MIFSITQDLIFYLNILCAKNLYKYKGQINEILSFQIAELKAELYRKQKESKERTLGQSSLVRPTPVPKVSH